MTDPRQWKILLQLMEILMREMTEWKSNTDEKLGMKLDRKDRIASLQAPTVEASFCFVCILKVVRNNMHAYYL